MDRTDLQEEAPEISGLFPGAGDIGEVRNGVSPRLDSCRNKAPQPGQEGQHQYGESSVDYPSPEPPSVLEGVAEDKEGGEYDERSVWA